MNAFNVYLLIFFLKYLPGSIFENTLCFGVSDFIAFCMVGLLTKRMKIVNVLMIAYTLSTTGLVMFLFFSSNLALVPVFVCLLRVGAQMAFNTGYVSVPRLFPTKFQSTVYAITNFFAHVVACLGPMVAEIPTPVPFISLLVGVLIALIAIRVLRELE